MTRRASFRLAFAALLLALPACAPGMLGGPGGDRGAVSIAVRWPQAARAGLKLLAVPAETASIRVTVRGDGIPDAAPIAPAKPLVPAAGGELAQELLEVPIGPKLVRAVAYDAAGTPLAAGEVPVIVEPQKIVEAHLKLAPVEGPDTSSPPPLPFGAWTLATVAGGDADGAADSGDPLQARFDGLQGLAYAPLDQVLYIADANNRLIRRYDLRSMALTSLLAARPASPAPLPAASAAASAKQIVLPSAAPSAEGERPAIGAPRGVAILPDGSVVFSDHAGAALWRVSLDGRATRLAGSGVPGFQDGAGAIARFNCPIGLAADAGGNVYVADAMNHRVRRVSATGVVSTLAGTGRAQSDGDGGLGTEAGLNAPVAVALDAAGTSLYVAEAQGKRVRRIQLATGVITAVAGTGRMGTVTDGSDATGADLSLPAALAVDASGALYVANAWNLRLGPGTGGTDFAYGNASLVYRIGTDGKIYRFAGRTSTSAYGFSGDGGPARDGELNNPTGLAVGPQGEIYVADTYNHRLRSLTPPAPSPQSPAPAPN